MEMLLDQNDARLRENSLLVAADEYGSDELRQLIKLMFDIMENKGAVGVAAPQIGVHKRVIVFGTDYAKRRTPEVQIPNTVLMNPEFKILFDAEEIGFEGCLNCGDLMGEVPRAAWIEYSGYDEEGHFIKKEAKGLEARIIQHEVDHLNGILFLDYIQNKDNLTTYTALQNKRSDATV